MKFRKRPCLQDSPFSQGTAQSRPMISQAFVQKSDSSESRRISALFFFITSSEQISAVHTIFGIDIRYLIFYRVIADK